MTVERPTFTTTRIEGYNRAQVDTAVDRIMEDLSLAQPSIDPSEVAEMGFEPTGFRAGYTIAEVDGWLDEVVVALGGPPPAPVDFATRAAALGLAPDPATGIVDDIGRNWGLLLIQGALLLVAVAILYFYFA